MLLCLLYTVTFAYDVFPPDRAGIVYSYVRAYCGAHGMAL